MPVKSFPSNPSLAHLKNQAKDLRKQHAAHDPQAAQRLREFHPKLHRLSDTQIFAASLKISDAQLAIAREYGFPSWARLKVHVENPGLAVQLKLRHDERIGDVNFRRAVELIDAGNVADLRGHLKQHAGLSRQHVVFEGGNYFHKPTLLEFIAENPVRHGKLPANIVEIANTLIDAGVDRSALNETLILVATGRVPRECHQQIPLIDLLCDSGADPDSASHASAVHGELNALEALLRRGTRLDLPMAAALGRIEDFHRLLPSAAGQDRHLAMALAVQYGDVRMVEELLAAGESARRYHPIGGHSHATPLHQAAGAGNFELVQLLLDRGASAKARDTLWGATPAGWAQHEGHREIAAFLLQRERED
jgi:hypothetical protein